MAKWRTVLNHPAGRVKCRAGVTDRRVRSRRAGLGRSARAESKVAVRRNRLRTVIRRGRRWVYGAPIAVDEG